MGFAGGEEEGGGARLFLTLLRLYGKTHSGLPHLHRASILLYIQSLCQLLCLAIIKRVRRKADRGGDGEEMQCWRSATVVGLVLVACLCTTTTAQKTDCSSDENGALFARGRRDANRFAISKWKNRCPEALQFESLLIASTPVSQGLRTVPLTQPFPWPGLEVGLA